jgi:hypothetical protein
MKYHITLLAMLVLIFGCIGCTDNGFQVGGHEITPAEIQTGSRIAAAGGLLAAQDSEKIDDAQFTTIVETTDFACEFLLAKLHEQEGDPVTSVDTTVLKDMITTLLATKDAATRQRVIPLIHMAIDMAVPLIPHIVPSDDPTDKAAKARIAIRLLRAAATGVREATAVYLPADSI